MEVLNNNIVNFIIRCIPLIFLTAYGTLYFIKSINKYKILKDTPNFEDLGEKEFKVKKVNKGFNSVTYIVEATEKDENVLYCDEMYVEKTKTIYKKGDIYGKLHVYANPNKKEHYLVMGKEEKFKVLNKQAWVMLLFGVVVWFGLIALGLCQFYMM